MSARLDDRKREILLLGLDPDDYDFGDDSVGASGFKTEYAENAKFLYFAAVGLGVLGLIALKANR